MIPLFPSFKKINIEDKEAVESHTHKYVPYSDYNFTSLWAWDTNGERMISELNGNLVVLFTDYETYAPSLSFLGTNQTLDTTLELIEFTKALGISPSLQYIAEDTAKDLTGSNIHIQEDIDNFDYIYSVSELAQLQGSKFKSKRHQANNFFCAYPEAIFKIVALNDTEVQKEIISVLRRWENKKISDKKEYDLRHEEIAIKRLLNEADKQSLVLSCVYIQNSLMGFSIDEIMPFNYALSHFFKADNSYDGIFDYLNQKIAQHFFERGIELWNMEQDLGIENLRKSKQSYRPVSFLKKYIISADNII